jgi:hypothetical protein
MSPQRKCTWNAPKQIEFRCRIKVEQRFLTEQFHVKFTKPTRQTVPPSNLIGTFSQLQKNVIVVVGCLNIGKALHQNECIRHQIVM